MKKRNTTRLTQSETTGEWYISVKHNGPDNIEIPARFTYNDVPVDFNINNTPPENPIKTGWITSIGHAPDRISREYTAVTVDDIYKYIVNYDEDIEIQPGKPNALFFISEGESTFSLIYNGEEIGVGAAPESFPTLFYMADNNDWEQYEAGETVNFKKLYLKGDNPRGFSTISNQYTIVLGGGNVICSGNIMRLLGAEVFEIPNDGCFSNLFRGCTNLISTPELSARRLTSECYSSMFEGCTSLIQPPTLPAITLAERCYSSMFRDCTSLTSTPELPVGTLMEGCYDSMFKGCTNLTNVHELPAITLSNNCYNSMFEGCTSLTQAPELPATTLVNGCYRNMFNGCTNLRIITCLATDINAEECTTDWANGVSFISGTFIKNPITANWTIGSNGIPEDWGIVNYCNDYLTFDILSDGVIFWGTKNESPTIIRSIEYKLNDNDWLEITQNGSFEVNANDKVLFRGRNLSYNTDDLHGTPYTFSGSTPNFNLHGNIMSLIQGDDFITATNLTKEFTFNMLFRDTNVIDASGLVLAADKLSENCYRMMFDGCTSLTAAPILPATKLASHCYYEMFASCTNLTEAPVLPATTLATCCYAYMFPNCTSLTQAPALPATTLAGGCYQAMFLGCTSLTIAPELPATTLADECYGGMHSEFGMFASCTNLKYIKCLATDISAADCTSNWVSGVQTDSGTFVTPSSTTWEEGSVNGIPANWTRTEP